MNELNNNYYSQTNDISVVNTFVRKVLLNMVVGLLITLIVPVYCTLFNPTLLLEMQRYIKFILIGQVALVLILSFSLNNISIFAARSMFYLYAFTNGIVLSGITFIFDIRAILYALAITITLFLVTAVYGYFTTEDLTKYSKFLMGGLITIILVSILNIFLKISLIYWAITVVGIVIFSALIAYDINRIKNLAIQNYNNVNLEKIGIIGALNLYLDFINLFLYILRLVSRKK